MFMLSELTSTMNGKKKNKNRRDFNTFNNLIHIYFGLFF